MTRRLLHQLLIVLVVIASVGAPTPAYASTFVVNFPVDLPDPFAGDGICGIFAPAPPAHMTSWGPCSLRAAIQEVNALGGSHEIQFAIPAPGVQTIDILSELPSIIHTVVIDGRSQGGAGYTGSPLIELNGANAGAAARGLFLVGDNSTLRGLAINRFSGPGIEILGDGDKIEGNFIGTDASGTVARGNGEGVRVDGTNHRIGGTTASARNLISGNTGSAIHFLPHAGTSVIQGNYIGTTVAGNAALGNGIGVEMWGYRNTIGGTTAGAGNVIAFNSGIGVELPLAFSGTWHNAILGNSIFSNGALGIDLATDIGGRGDGVTPNDDEDWDVGADMLQNYPVLTSATSGASGKVTGTLNSEANAVYRIEFFVSPTCDPSGHGEGASFLGGGDVTTDNNGNVSFTATVAALTAGQVVTATTTNVATNDTSEFSACRTAAAPTPPGIAVTPTSGLVTTEAGGTATFTVVLQSMPTANVTIGLSSSDTTEGTVSPSSLTFTPTNWNVPQTVTVTGVDDSIVDGNVAYTIVTAPAQSADPAYNGLNADDVAVTDQDNDTAPPPPPAAVCAPRPDVKVKATPAGPGLLQVTLTAQTLPATPNNSFQQIVFLKLDNATVLVNGSSPPAGAVVPLGGAGTFTFLAHRTTPGVATTVHFVVTDACGDWSSFVGGGPNAF